jgi:hypothetical protein
MRIGCAAAVFGIWISSTPARLVMVSFTYMRSEADRVLTPVPLKLVFVSP